MNAAQGKTKSIAKYTLLIYIFVEMAKEREGNEGARTRESGRWEELLCSRVLLPFTHSQTNVVECRICEFPSTRTRITIDGG